MSQRINTVIFAGVQASLATSYYLKQAGREDVVLERGSAHKPRLIVERRLRGHKVLR